MTKLIQKINNIPKSYFTFNDIKKISSLTDESLKVSISRLIKAGKLISLRKGYYAVDKASLDLENLAVEIYKPSYISLEWALAYYGILNQQALNITLATTKRSKEIEINNSVLIYKHIQDKMYFGYQAKDNFLIASPEKAFIDLVYLSLNGYARLDTEEMDIGAINKAKINKIIRKIDNKKLTKKVMDIIK